MNKAYRRSADSLFEIGLELFLNLPELLTVGLRPAKATNFLTLLNLPTSPMSGQQYNIARYMI